MARTPGTITTYENTLRAIQVELSNPEWSADTVANIAHIMEDAGFGVAEADDEYVASVKTQE